MQKIKIKEAIVVEGRDDTIALKRAVDAFIIETHGYGIKKETWDVLQKAYKERGLIIFTDPDFAGKEIRKRITAKFPNSKQAFLSQKDATKKGDIGIENAEPEVIVEALGKVHYTTNDNKTVFTESDLYEAGLIGEASSKDKRERLGKALGIGYGNAKSLLNKLNQFGITREEYYEALRTIDN